MLALITGASSGIGMEMAKYFNELNIDLILVARRKDRLEELKKDFKVNVEIIDLDLSKIDNVKKLYESTKDKGVDILVNNAGFGLFGEFVETDVEREFEMIDVNIKAPHYLTKMFLKDFVKRDSGYILNVASSAAFLAGPLLSTYYATKNYICRLTEAIWEELRRKKSNVHISALCPGPVETEFNKVAKGKFKKPGISAKYVAKYAIDNMFEKKLIIVPTLKMRLAVRFNIFLPRKLGLKYIYDYQNNKIKNS